MSSRSQRRSRASRSTARRSNDASSISPERKSAEIPAATTRGVVTPPTAVCNAPSGGVTSRASPRVETMERQLRALAFVQRDTRDGLPQLPDALQLPSERDQKRRQFPYSSESHRHPVP